MKKPLTIFALCTVLFALGATLFAQTTTGSSLITQMKAAIHAFTLAGDLNPGVTDLSSSPVSGKKTGDMLTAGEYNRILELVGQGAGGGVGGFTTTLFDDITDGLSNGGVKTYTCPEGQFVLSVTSVMIPSGQYSCANSANADKKSVSYNSCAAQSGQRWHTHIICGGGGGGAGGGGDVWVDVSTTDTADYDPTCIYRIETSGASGAKFRYSVGMSTKNAMFGWNIITGWVGGTVISTDKKHFTVQGYTSTQNNEYDVLKMHKLCAGTGGGGSGDSAPSGTLCGALFTQRDGVGGTTCTNTNNTAKCAGQTLSMPAACGNTNPCAAMTGCPAGYTPVATAYSWGGGQTVQTPVYMYNQCSCAKQ